MTCSNFELLCKKKKLEKIKIQKLMTRSFFFEPEIIIKDNKKKINKEGKKKVLEKIPFPQ